METREYKQKMRQIYEKMGSHKEKYTVSINRTEIDVFPNVYSPNYYNDSTWFAKVIPEIVGKNKFLEVGCGTGIITLCTALNGSVVTAIDINPYAVKNTKHNFRKLGLNLEVYQGDMFETLPPEKKFDFIFWSHPFNKGKNKNESFLLQSGFDYQYKSIKKYIKQAHLHLAKNGRLLLGTGKFALLSEIKDIAKKEDYKIKLLRLIKIPVSKQTPIESDLRVYEFIKNDKI
ncbi:MAG: methyltransferase domain-containing protein [Nanoarchaeota archaeon]|nr:methyltransferase domain-containing protein [Nanoarchaeota archaeon]